MFSTFTPIFFIEISFVYPPPDGCEVHLSPVMYAPSKDANLNASFVGAGGGGEVGLHLGSKNTVKISIVFENLSKDSFVFRME